MQERWRQRLADSEAAAAAKLGRERELVAQFQGTITELSQDVSGLTRDVQCLREDKSALQSHSDALQAELENQQVRRHFACTPTNRLCRFRLRLDGKLLLTAQARFSKQRCLMSAPLQINGECAYEEAEVQDDSRSSL